MKNYLKPALSLIAISFFCSSLQAASIKYTFTFNATSVSALTSYYLTSPSLLTGNNNFNSSRITVTSPPAPGAIIPPNFPVVVVNESGSVGIPFGNSKATWQFTGLTAPLAAFGTYALETGSDVTSAGVSHLVTGSVVIGSSPQTSTPEPGALLLSGTGLLLLGLAVKLKRQRA